MAEKQGHPVSGEGFDNSHYLTQKAHVQHPIGLIKDQEPDMFGFQIPMRNVIIDPVIKNRQLYINDQVQQEPYLSASMNYQFGPVVVPPNSYFVMGDNRNNSYDSHPWEAWLTRDHLIGKAFCIYWPLDHLQILKH